MSVYADLFMLLVDGSYTGISSVATTRDAITIATATKIQRRRENYRGSIKEYWRLEYRRQMRGDYFSFDFVILACENIHPKQSRA